MSSIVFSPDGRLLATASGDGAVKVWDAITGHEALSFQGRLGRLMSVGFSLNLNDEGSFGGFETVTFSPDSLKLAAASWRGTVKVWEAKPPTPDVILQREAVYLVESLYLKLGLKEQVIQTLRNDPHLSDPLRREAVALAEKYRPNPEELNQISWAIVCRSTASTAAYNQALGLAEEACRLRPDYGLFLNTLGVAQYRNGRYSDALETLTKSEKLNALAFNGPHPADLAFLAMTQHRLGKHDQARATLERLQERIKDPQFAQDQEAQDFLIEAETLILGRPASPKKIPLIR